MYIQIFDCTGVSSPNPCIVQWSTVANFTTYEVIVKLRYAKLSKLEMIEKYLNMWKTSSIILP